MENFARNLKDIIEEYVQRAGTSVEAIAQQVGTSRSMMYRYMNGRHMPTIPIFKKICQSIGCQYEDILGELKN